MSLKLYDTALENKLRKWLNNEKLTITGPDETRRVFQWKADMSGDSPIQLPLVSISRNHTLSVLNISKRPMTFDGYTIAASDAGIKSLSAIPISLSYVINIYTRYLDEGDEYLRNFLFNIINYPQLEVQIPYNNSTETHISNIRLQSEVEDNSDIPERLIEGQFTRFTIGITIDDAYMWSVPIRGNIAIEAETEVVLKEDK